jgi:hypothetical protein
MTKNRPGRPAIGAMYVGLGLTVVAMVVPFIDRATGATGSMLAGHIRAGYPTYAQERIDSAVTMYLIYLSVLGVLGVVSWFLVIGAVSAGKRWARSIATLALALGGSIALFNLFVRDTSGDTGLPPLLGLVGVLPSVAGLLAVTLLWRGSLPTARA